MAGYQEHYQVIKGDGDESDFPSWVINQDGKKCSPTGHGRAEYDQLLILVSIAMTPMAGDWKK